MRYIVDELTEGINVWTIHDWYEALCEGQFVEEFTVLARERGYRFVTLQEIATEILQHPVTIPTCPIESRPVDGGIGDVTWQVIDCLNGDLLDG